MKNRTAYRLFPAACMALALCSSPSLKAAQADLILDGVTVVDVKDGRLSPRMSVLIHEGKIARIAPQIASAGAAQRVDASGKFVVPGYLDMHAHPLNAPDPRATLKLMLSNGITGYRQMSGSPELLRARREGRLDFADSPALLLLPGTILTDTLAPTPDAARAEVRRQKADGADFIKTVGLSNRNFYAAGEEAKAQGLPYAGHMNMDVNVREAAKVMHAIEHLGPLEVMLLGCSREEAPIREAFSHVHIEPPQVGPASPAAQAMIARAIANPAMLPRPEQFRSLQRVIDSYDETKCRELAGELIRDGAWQVPTLIRLRTMQVADDPAYRNDPNLRFMPAPVRQMWSELGTQFPQRISVADRAVYRRFFDLQLRGRAGRHAVGGRASWRHLHIGLLRRAGRVADGAGGGLPHPDRRAGPPRLRRQPHPAAARRHHPRPGQGAHRGAA
ncbi:hypothetical protein SAMN05444680_106153 [Variovorax sp. YR216]|nr:hypothetical protein SAMN05444680_106153 [Variovorax sp. YR216]